MESRYFRLYFCCSRIPRSSSALNTIGIRRHVHGSAQLERIPVGTSPTDAYNQLVRSGSIYSDENQLAALQPFERLFRELRDYTPPSQGLASRILRAVRAYAAPKGVYVCGGVGAGKSLVADIFYHCSPVKSKRRIHFHQFMLDVHKRLHERWLRGEQRKKHDIIAIVAQDLLEAGWLFCFDEFQVIDIADAMILKRLLESLFKSGAVMITSSNRSPNELYKNGIQRELFLPCIDLIEHYCEVHAFQPGSPDYRLIGARPDGSSALSTVWYTPLSEGTAELVEKAFTHLAKQCLIEPTVLKVGSRSIQVPRAAGGIAYFSFADLCDTPKGASDYLAIATSFHTVFVVDIPQMNSSHNEMARRFITLIDILYEQKVKLIARSSVEPKDLYLPRVEELNGTHMQTKGLQSLYEEKDEEFAFARAVSRLNHMQSLGYLSAPWEPPGKAFIFHLEKSRLQEGDLRRIWDRYNIDTDAKLSRSELLLMMEDLTEIKSGHRNVPEELLDDMFHKLDANGDGDVVWTEFRDYFLRYGLEIQSL